jgi:hypothetical protein
MNMKAAIAIACALLFWTVKLNWVPEVSPWLLPVDLFIFSVFASLAVFDLFSWLFLKKGQRPGLATSQGGTAKSPNISELTVEREFLENQMNSRFQMFLITYSLVFNAIVTARTFWTTVFVLSTGVIMCASLSLSVSRAYLRLVPIVDAMSADPTSPLGWSLHQSSWQKRFAGFLSSNRIMGTITPTVCTLAMLCALLAVLWGAWTPWKS